METTIAILAIGIAIATAIALFVQTRFQHKQLKQTENNQYDETLRKSMGDLYQVYRTDANVKTKDECELFATRILDILAVLAHLNNNKKIDDDILDFVKFDLEIAKGIMKWFDKEGLGEKYHPARKAGIGYPSAEIWSSLTKYFDKHETKICNDAALPDCIQNYKNLNWVALSKNLFVYGTLTTDGTLKKVLGRDVLGIPATLDGYDGSKAITIESESYPAAEKNTECSIQGLLVKITPEELEKLDVYETDAYRRKEVELTNGKKAWVYLNKNSE